MPRFRRLNDAGLQRGRDRLVAEADAEDRNLAVQFSRDIDRAARLGRRAGARGNDNRLRCEPTDIVDRYVIVPHDARLLPQPREVPREVVDEAVVVVDEQDQLCGR